MNILIAICTKGKVTIEHEYCLLLQTWPLGHGRDFFVAKGHTIENARNIAVKQAIDRDFDVLMFYDDDMLPTTTDALMKMITVLDQNKKVDVLAAAYPRRTSVPEPVVVKEKGSGPFWGWKDGKVHECWMVGTGFTAYRVSALKKASEKAKKYKVRSGNIENAKIEKLELPRVFRMDGGSTDDFHFAMDYEDLEIRQYVHGGVICQQIDLKSGGVWDLKNSDTTQLIVDSDKPRRAADEDRKKRKVAATAEKQAVAAARGR